MGALKAMLADESGQGILEYALILSLISVAAFVVLKFLGLKANNTMNNSANTLGNVLQ